MGHHAFVIWATMSGKKHYLTSAGTKRWSTDVGDATWFPTKEAATRARQKWGFGVIELLQVLK